MPQIEQKNQQENLEVLNLVNPKDVTLNAGLETLDDSKTLYSTLWEKIKSVANKSRIDTGTTQMYSVEFKDNNGLRESVQLHILSESRSEISYSKGKFKEWNEVPAFNKDDMIVIWMDTNGIAEWDESGAYGFFGPDETGVYSTWFLDVTNTKNILDENDAIGKIQKINKLLDKIVIKRIPPIPGSTNVDILPPNSTNIDNIVTENPENKSNLPPVPNPTIVDPPLLPKSTQAE